MTLGPVYRPLLRALHPADALLGGRLALVFLSVRPVFVPKPWWRVRLRWLLPQ
jgi:hypothetical protein